MALKTDAPCTSPSEWTLLSLASVLGRPTVEGSSGSHPRPSIALAHLRADLVRRVGAP
jgi:hypothetical protein